uniref:Solute carrier family 29 member 2 n=1 Tax=Salmo trutta TaxID=8032 RepID=A0A673WD59_SALTR
MCTFILCARAVWSTCKALHRSARHVTTDPGLILGCVAAGRDRGTHEAAHNWPILTIFSLPLKDKEKLALVNGDLNGFNNKPIITNGDFEASGTKEALFMMEQTDSHTRSSVLAVFKKIWVMALCVTCVLLVTLSVFPAVTVKVKSVYGNKEWAAPIPQTCFSCLTVSVFIHPQPSKRSGLFPVLVVSRVVFIPLIMLCNIDNRQYLPVLFSHDIAFLVIMTLFALSNGYFICLCMSYAPQTKDCESAGALMTFFLALGLSLGAALSFLLRNLL